MPARRLAESPPCSPKSRWVLRVGNAEGVLQTSPRLPASGYLGLNAPRPQPQRGLWRAPESAYEQRGESPLRTEHWLSVAGGNCVVERRGGEQPEANCQSINSTMMNSIRFYPLASLRHKGEAQNRKPTREGQGNFGDPCCGKTVSVAAGVDGMLGDGTAGSWCDVNQGSRSGKGDGVHGPAREGPEEPCPEGDRASVRAKKRGNARGAKGGRKVKA